MSRALRIMGFSSLCIFTPILYSPSIVLACDGSAQSCFQGEGQGNRISRRERIKQFCSENPDDQRCQQWQEKQELWRFCRENRDDEKCVAMRQKKKEKIAQLREECQADPFSESCERLERFRKWHRRHGSGGHRKHSRQESSSRPDPLDSDQF